MALKYYTQDCEFTFSGKVHTRSWVGDVVRERGFRVGAVSVVFCSDNYLLGINREYLSHDYFTDIITFDDTDMEGKIIAGDLFISIDTVRSNAEKFGETFERELQRVVIHGILHLMGQGDKTEPEARQMRALEEQALMLWDTAWEKQK